MANFIKEDFNDK